MKKLLSVLLTISLLLTSTVLFTTNVSAIEPEIWDGSVATSFASGTGLESDPFIIETAEQLAYLVSVGASGKYIKLANDIYLNDTSDWTDWETNPPKNEWIPNELKGILDGDNHTIYGLYSSGNEYGGLFLTGGTIKNINLKKSYIHATKYAGGIAAYNSNVYGCHNFGTVVSSEYAGGIVGYQEVCSISLCSNHGMISGKYAGGIMGYFVSDLSLLDHKLSYSYLSSSYNKGSVYGSESAGGLVGVMSTEIRKVYYDTEYEYYSRYPYEIYYYVSYVEISDCYNCGEISSGKYAGGLCGRAPYGQSYSAYTEYYDNYGVKVKMYNYTYENCYNVGKISGVTCGQILGYGTRMNSSCVYYYNSEATVMDFSGSSSSTIGQSTLETAINGFGFYEKNGKYIKYGNPDYPYPELKDNLQPHDHTYSETVNSEASCTQDGSKTLTCWCGDAYDEVILAQGHNYEETIVEEATCTDDGLKTLLCFCGDTYDEIIPATGHDYDETVVEATCTQAGSKTYLCHCGKTYIETLPALGHNIVTITVEPTCTQNGETYSQCTDCKTILGEKETLEATGHTYKENIDKNATCTESGIKVYTCPCGDEYTEIISATGHKLKLYSQPSTCTDAGFEYYICENCGNMIGDTEYLPKLGHSYKESVIAEADCTSDGEILYTCERCEDSYTQTIPASGHTFSEWTIEVEPTCTESGMKQRVCADCSETEELELPMVEHSWEAEFTIDKYANCTENGSKSIHCSDCQATKDTTEVSATGHLFGEWVISLAPTCTQSGMKEKTCTNCDEIVSEELAATGHNGSGWIVTVAPTKKTDGKQVKKCTSCGVVLAEEILPKTLGPNDKVHSVLIDNVSMNYKNTVSLNPVINVADGINYRVEYTSSDSHIARIDANGNVYGAGTGNATITCTVTDEFGNVVSDTCDVEVSYQWWQWIIVIVLFGWIWY